VRLIRKCRLRFRPAKLERADARYLALFKYSEAGAKGLMKEKAAAREAAGKKAYESVGGKSEALYWIPNGEYHGAEIFELPNAATAAAISAFVYSTGAFSEYRTIELLTTSEPDAALEKPVAYRPPGG
jgi:uncharacterized protein with GYD domain